MTTLLSKHVDETRRSREKNALAAFEQYYEAVLPLLVGSDVRYLIEPVTGGQTLWVEFYRWRGGYLYYMKWPLRPEGAIEGQGQAMQPEEFAELLFEETSKWDKWAAAQAWQEKRFYWQVGQVLLGWAMLVAAGLVLLSQGDAFAWQGLAWTGGFWLAITLGLLKDQHEHFPQGMVPKPAHVRRTVPAGSSERVSHVQ